MEELKPCPFCGKQPEVIKRPDRMDGFFCAISCFCGGNTSRADQFATDKTSVDAAYEKAAKLWNRRTVPENKPLTVEQLRQLGGEPVYMVYARHEYDSWMLDDDADDYVYEMCHNGATAYARKPEGSET